MQKGSLSQYASRIFSLLLFVAFQFSCVFAQKAVKGSVKNGDGEPLAGASLLLYPDSLLTPPMSDYAITGKDGAFLLVNVSDSVAWLQVRCVGYKDCIAKITDTTRNYCFTLHPSSATLGEIIVTSRYSGINVSGDTIKYDADHFRNGFEGNVGELLSNMPGVNVDEGGNVSYGGRTVSHLLVNGNDLLSGNNKGTVVKNMLPDDVASVEFINNYQSENLNDVYSGNKQVALNLKTKGAKDVSMYAEANGGYRDKYEAKAFGMSVGRKESATAIMSGNNIGVPVMTSSEYIGVIAPTDNHLAGATKVSLSGAEASMIFRPDKTYEDTGQMLMADGRRHFTDKLTVGGNVVFHHSDTRGQTLREESYLQSGLHNSSNIDSRDIGNMLIARVRSDWKPTSIFQMLANVSLRALGTKSNVSADNSIENSNYAQGCDYSKQAVVVNVSSNLLLGQDLAYFSVMADYSNEESQFELTSRQRILPVTYQTTTGGFLFGQKQNGGNDNILSEIGYKHRIGKGYHLSANFSFRYISQQLRLKYSSDTLCNSETLRTNESKGSVSFRKSMGKFNFNIVAAIALHHSSLVPAFKRTGCDVLPAFDLSYKFSPTREFSLSAYRTMETIDRDKLSSLDIVNGYNDMTTSTQITSPYQLSSNLRLSYHNYDIARQWFFTSMASVQICRNAATAVVQQQQLANVVSYRNDGHYCNVYGFLDVDKRLASLPINVKATFFVNYIQTPSVLNDEEQRRKYTSLSAVVKSTTRFRTMINAEIEVKNVYSLTSVEPASSKTRINDFSVNGKLMLASGNFKSKLILGYNHVNSEHTDCSLFDMGFTFEYHMKKLMFKITAKNILNTKNNDWLQTYSTSYYLSTERYRRVPGYILLGLRWQY